MTNNISRIMKFKTTPYHSHLIKDTERLSAFYEGISQYAEDLDYLENEEGLINKVVYDLGCGSGVLTYFAALYFSAVVGFEKDSKIAGYAKENLKDFENVLIVNEDVLKLEGLDKADLIICEMLDTALIDEEEVLALNHFIDFKEDNCTVIPSKVLNYVEPVSMERRNVHWEDDDYHPNYNIIGKSICYSEIDLQSRIDENFEDVLEFAINEDSKFNGIKITTITLIRDNIVCGPTPMFNPPLFIPVDEINCRAGDTVKVKLSYKMGGGIETIKTELI
ncbi:methyltransferase domain-containing protein [Methanobrevibacter boviskoreani]|uniref:methyltransferase domain-containing protein n=2 Tax=Methanobrevibacter boviskoreani TaxID=1348249 RepID=UPI0023A80F02|nr:methyltransferase domain-containing protein [Methanobrevibacter boviskoreani]MCI6774681.1 methyltransferase domain-containing protein [Methanobrevibacter boviskoreani]